MLKTDLLNIFKDHSQPDLQSIEGGAPLRESLTPDELTQEFVGGLFNAQNWKEALRTPQGKASLIGLASITIATIAGIEDVGHVHGMGHRIGHDNLSSSHDVGGGHDAIGPVNPNVGTTIHSIIDLPPTDLNWVRNHVKFGDQPRDPDGAKEKIHSINQTSTGFEDLFGLGAIDYYGLVKYGDGSEAYSGVQGLMDSVLVDFANDGIAINPESMYAVVPTDEVVVLRAKRPTEKDRRPVVSSAIGQNGSIIFASDMDGNQFAVFGLSKAGKMEAVGRDTKTLVKIDVGLGKMGTPDQNAVGFLDGNGNFVTLLEFDENGKLISVATPTDGDGESPAGISSLQSRARVDIENMKRFGEEPAAESAVLKVLKDNAVSPETYTVADVDGAVKVTDNETGIVMMQSSESGILYGIEFATKIAANSCESTHFKPNKNGMIEYNKNYSPTPAEYFTDLIYKELGHHGESGTNSYYILVNREKQCWASTDGTYFFYRDNDKVAQKVPLIPLTLEQLEKFAFTPR